MAARRRARTAALTIAVALVAAACGGDGTERATTPTSRATGANGTAIGGASEPATDWPSFAVPRPARTLYDPFAAGEPAPDGYRQLLPRDAIAPVYDPAFVPASMSSWPAETLVIGVDLEGEARAYPVGFLNRREIVVDMHRGIPTLVTW